VDNEDEPTEKENQTATAVDIATTESTSKTVEETEDSHDGAKCSVAPASSDDPVKGEEVSKTPTKAEEEDVDEDDDWVNVKKQ
jgi:hypothetical protein